MNSDGMLQFVRDGNLNNPFQSIAGDPWFLRNVNGYAANVYVEQAFNEPGCWLEADGWSDGEGFMLLPGNGCNDCFTTYLCSSNHGDYLAPPQPPVSAPVPITPVSIVDVCSSAGEFRYEVPRVHRPSDLGDDDGWS